MADNHPMSTLQRLAILGSTGSIGRNALEVIAAASGKYRVLALSAHRKLAFNPQADQEELAAETTLADIQLIILKDISESYRLRPVARKGKLLVVELIPR